MIILNLNHTAAWCNLQTMHHIICSTIINIIISSVWIFQGVTQRLF